MSQNGVSGAYFRNEMIMEGIGYQTISENTRASDDVFLFIQREHTPGVIRMLVRTEENGNFLFVTEGIYSKLNFGPLVVLPGLCVDLRSYKANIDRVRSLSEEYDAIIVFGHDVKTMEIVTGVVSINMVEKDADKTGSRINGENWDVMAMATYGIGACHLS